MKKTGTVESLNYSPKGTYEGVLLKADEGVIQVNFPKEVPEGSHDGWEPGEEVSVEVEAGEARGAAAHKVFRLVRVVNGAANGHGGDHGAAREFSGKVERLNYALHGEVNGGVLDSGDFLHLKPEGARAVGLKVGMSVQARGRTKPMRGGGVVIEAEEVNGMAIEHHKDKKKHAK